jgi:hypothetical protein
MRLGKLSEDFRLSILDCHFDILFVYSNDLFIILLILKILVRKSSDNFPSLIVIYLCNCTEILTVYLHLLSDVLYGVITDVQSSPVIRWSSGENDINHPGNPLHRPLNRGNLDDLINRRTKRCNIFLLTLIYVIFSTRSPYYRRRLNIGYYTVQNITQ